MLLGCFHPNCYQSRSRIFLKFSRSIAVVVVVGIVWPLWQLSLALAQMPKGLATPSPSYQVGPNDELYIVVMNEDDLTTQVKISAEGKIAFPLLGTLMVGGATIQQVEKLLTQALADGFLRHPQVIVYMAQYRDFYVTGAVNIPGGYPYEQGLTVLKAISLAGGLRPDAEEDKIEIVRKVQDQEDRLKADMTLLVQPGDQIDVASTLISP